MALMDGLVALAVIAGFGYIILVKLMKKHPKIQEHLKEYTKLTTTPEVLEVPSNSEAFQRVYTENRSMI